MEDQHDGRYVRVATNSGPVVVLRNRGEAQTVAHNLRLALHAAGAGRGALREMGEPPMIDTAIDEDVRVMAETAVPGRWLLEQFAPDLEAMLSTSPDAADLSHLTGLLMQGIAEVAQERYRELSGACAAAPCS